MLKEDGEKEEENEDELGQTLIIIKIFYKSDDPTIPKQ
jgi:hypothetical protein